MLPDSSPPHGSLYNLWRIRSHLRPYLSQMIWMFVAAAGGTGAGIVVPLVVQRVVDGPVRHRDPAGLLALGGLALLLGLVEAGLIFIRRWTQSGVALGMEYAMRNELYAHLQRLPVSFHDRWQSGQLLSRVTTDLSVIRRFLSFGLIFLIVNAATYVVVVIMLLRLYWPLGSLVAVTAVPLFLLSNWFGRSYIKASRALQDQQGDLATVVEESAQGIRVIKSFGRRRYMAERFRADARRIHDTAVGKAHLQGRTWSAFDAVPNVTLAIVLVGGAYAVGSGGMTVGQLVAFVSLQLMLVWPIDSLGWIIANGQEAMTAADRVYEVLDVQPSIVDKPGLDPPADRPATAVAVDAVAVDATVVAADGTVVAADGTAAAVAAGRGTVQPGALAAADRPGASTAVRRGAPEGRLRFEGVAFRYPGADQDVLRRIELDVEPGETIAIAGATGSGKTTLISLVPRLYDVTAGRVTLDGRDVRDYPLAELRSRVGVAFEEPTLFSMSVWENLTLGRPDATEDEVAEALVVAQAEFVHDLPWGLETRVGEQGLSLSGGQRQRLALARAVLTRPKVLVLDDPLSALDVDTEARVEQALSRVLRGTTALVVVHRPSTVALADRVALLHHGVLTAVGTHTELLASEPAYREVLSAAADPSEVNA